MREKKSAGGAGTAVNDQLVAQVNSNPVDAALMMELADRISELPPEDRTFEGYAFTVLGCLRSKEKPVPQKKLFDLMTSAMFRIEALLRTIGKGKLPGWTKPDSEEGCLLAHPALFIAAGEADVAYRGKRLTFDRKALLQLAFQHAKNYRLGQ